MRIENATPAAVYAVAARMREHDRLELSAVLPFDHVPDIALHLANTYGERDDVKVVYVEDRPVAVIGAVMTRPNSLALLMFATREITTIGLPLTRWLRREWLPRMAGAGVHRIEAASILGYPDMHRWLRSLGLKREALMKRFGKRGESFLLYAWCKP